MFLLLSFTGAYAQAVDSSIAVPKGKTRYSTPDDIKKSPEQLRGMDSSLAPVHYYDPNYLQNMGVVGSVRIPIIFNPFVTDGFRLGFDQWESNRFRFNSLPFYNTQNPYTDFHYTQGGQNVQEFRAIFSANLRPNWNFTLQYRHMATALGSYDNQQNKLNNFAANTWYRSPNKRFMVLAAAIFNKFQQQENGGLSNDSIFLNSSSANRTGLPVNMAANAKQLWNEQNYTLQEYMYLGPSENKKLNDTDSVGHTILHPRYFVSHTFNFFQNRYQYNDMQPVGAYYENFFTNNYYTNERSIQRTFSNELSIGKLEEGEKSKVKDSSGAGHLFFRFFGKYDYTQVKEITYNPNIYNISLGGEFDKNGKLGIDGSARYYILGHNQGDYTGNASIKIPFIERIHLPILKLYVQTQQYSPSLVDQFYFSNHFYWTNQFGSTKAQEIGVSAYDTATKFKVTGSFNTVNGYIYYNQFILPVQANTDIRYMRINAVKTLHFGHFFFSHDLTYQKVLSGDYLRLPAFIARLSYYYEYKFSFPLLLQTGFNLSYYSSWYANAYMPDISRFYVQDNIKVGNYPFIDVWAAFKVKRFQAFLKLEHANQGLTGSNYFLMPHYPMYPRAIRLGLRWYFFN